MCSSNVYITSSVSSCFPSQLICINLDLFKRTSQKIWTYFFFLLTQMESEITRTTEISEAATRGVLLKKTVLKNVAIF